MTLHLVQRKGQFGDCLVLADEHGVAVPGLQMLELKEETDSLNTVSMRFVMLPGGIVMGEPSIGHMKRVDQLVEQAKAEINEMAAKAKAKILGDQISIGLPGVLDAREASQIAGALARRAGPRYA
ncbi:hypothetical protein [Metapseudomonas sp. CR1201]